VVGSAVVRAAAAVGAGAVEAKVEVAMKAAGRAAAVSPAVAEALVAHRQESWEGRAAAVVSAAV